MIEGHTVLTCNAYTCTAILAVLPGAWVKRTRLGPGEKAAPGCGSLVCGKCNARWEVRPDWEAMALGLEKAA